MKNILNKITKLSNLENNWDGYNALAIHTEIIKKVTDLILSLDSVSVNAISDCYANPNGTLSIEWETNYGKMQLEIGLSNFSYFIKNTNLKPIIVNGEELLLSKFKSDLILYLAKNN